MRQPAFLLALALAACTSPPAEPGHDAGPPSTDAPPALADVPIVADAGADAPTAPPVDAPTAPRDDTGPTDADPRCVPSLGPSREFVVLYDDVIVANGCTGGRCHDGTDPRYGPFDMSDSVTAFRNLVGAEGCMGVRVAPCRPEDSYLSEVIRLDDGICGRSRHTAGHLSEADATRIDDWILSGAH